MATAEDTFLIPDFILNFIDPTFDQDDYRQMLLDLLPPGIAWNRNPTSNLSKLMDSRAKGAEVVDAQASKIPEEANPKTSIELLPDWFRVAKVPSICLQKFGVILTDEEKRIQLLFKLSLTGSLSKAAILDAITRAGLTATIEEAFVATVGRPVGIPIADEQWTFVFIVTSPDLGLDFFEVGQEDAGDPLVIENGLLRCIVNDHKPAHTLAIFIDTALPPPTP